MITLGHADRIQYTLSLHSPGRHEATVTMIIPVQNADTLTLAMPAWSPGRYVIYNFAKNVFDISARDEQVRLIRPLLIDKQTWKIPCRGKGKITFSYRVFANTLDGTFSKIDSNGASLNGAGIFMYVQGRKNWPVRLKIEHPQNWQVVTPMQKQKDVYLAANYDRLIDSPIEMGRVFTYSFYVLGKRHTLVFHRAVRQNILKTFENDLSKVIRYHASLFGDTLPYKRYVFFFHLQPQLAHPDGMEHLNSCRVLLRMDVNSIVCNANTDPDYDNLIWLSAHEFFHTWNVKRLRPAGLGPFDYSKEVYTPSLWIVEGWTSYYAYLTLLRTGIYTQEKWLSEISGRISRYEHAPGKKYRTLAETSILTWLFKGHVPVYAQTNIEQTTYSYYYKGLIAGFLLDALLRSESKGAYSLDRFIGDLWRQFYQRPKTSYYLAGKGYSEKDVENQIIQKLGQTGKEFLRKAVHSTEPLPYDLLHNLGLQLKEDKTRKEFILEKTPLANAQQRMQWKAFVQGQ